RRRHTRFSRDWSSDVCYSDLKEYLAYANSTDVKELLLLDNITSEFYLHFNDAKALRNYQKSKDQRRWLERNISKTSFPNASTARSEERRVGKSVNLVR